MAVFTAQMAIQLHDLRIAMAEPLQQLSVFCTIAVGFRAEEMSQAVNRPVGESDFALRCRKLVLESFDHVALKRLQDSTVAKPSAFLPAKDESVPVARQSYQHLAECGVHWQRPTALAFDATFLSCLLASRARTLIGEADGVRREVNIGPAELREFVNSQAGSGQRRDYPSRKLALLAGPRPLPMKLAGR